MSENLREQPNFLWLLPENGNLPVSIADLRGMSYNFYRLTMTYPDCMISASNPSEISLFLELLSELERECEDAVKSAILNQCFCERIIPLLQTHPLIQPLRDKWLEKRALLDFDIQKAERDSLRESKMSFQKIERSLKGLTPSPNENINRQVAFINKILLGQERYCSPPFHGVIFDEIKKLLILLVEACYLDLCKKFAQIDVRKVSIPIDPNAKGYWAIFERGETEGITNVYDENQIKDLPQEIRRRLYYFRPEEHWVTIPYIKKCTFSPSFEKTFAISQEAHPERTQDASVVWWYFESALFLWNLPSTFFNRSTPQLKTKKACSDHFKNLQAISIWRELHDENDSTQKIRLPIIFTPILFKQGFKTLVTEIKAYLSSAPFSQLNDETVTFELLLETGDQMEGRDVNLGSNHLWIAVSIGNAAPKHYYLKRFNDGSDPFVFATTLLNDHAQGGDVEVDLKDPSDSVPKCIERIGLRKEVKNLFFGRSRGCKVLFKGSKISFLKKDRKDFCLIMRSIETIHQKNGSPSFCLS